MGRHEELRNRLERLGANWTQWRGRDVVADYGDPGREYQAVRGDGIGLVDRSWRDTLVVMGEDGSSWLQGLVTNDLRELVRQGSGQLSGVLNVVGRLIADIRILALPDLLMLDLEAGLIEEALMAHFERHIFGEDVTLLDRSEPTAKLGVFGADAAALLQSLCELSRPVGALEVYEGSWGVLDGMDVVIQRVELTGGPGYELSCSADEAAAVWDRLAEAEGVVPVGFETVETLRVEAGIPRFGKELSEKRIPLEVGMESAISFNKGCYLGQEIIARLDSRGTPARLLRTLVFEGGAAPLEGASVEREGKGVGEVVTSVWSPLLQAPLALAFIKRGHNEIGQQLSVDTRPVRVQALGHALASGVGSV